MVTYDAWAKVESLAVWFWINLEGKLVFLVFFPRYCPPSSANFVMFSRSWCLQKPFGSSDIHFKLNGFHTHQPVSASVFFVSNARLTWSSITCDLLNWLMKPQNKPSPTLAHSWVYPYDLDDLEWWDGLWHPLHSSRRTGPFCDVPPPHTAACTDLSRQDPLKCWRMRAENQKTETQQ